MEIQYFGGNCVKINTKKASLVVDDNLKSLGLKSVTRADDIVLITSGESAEVVADGVKLVIDQPGEYEISDVSVKGIPARAHTDEKGQKSATIYRLVADDVRIVALGHIYPALNEAQLEAIGTVDVLLVPVGGHGFTLDSVGALQVIKKIEPKIVIPTNYADSGLEYPVPAEDIEAVIKSWAMEPKERTPKLKLKNTDILTEQTQLIILERQ